MYVSVCVCLHSVKQLVSCPIATGIWVYVCVCVCLYVLVCVCVWCVCVCVFLHSVEQYWSVAHYRQVSGVCVCVCVCLYVHVGV